MLSKNWALDEYTFTELADNLAMVVGEYHDPETYQGVVERADGLATDQCERCVDSSQLHMKPEPRDRRGGQRVPGQPCTCPSELGADGGSNLAGSGVVVMLVDHPGPAVRPASAMAAATMGPPAVSMVKTTFPGLLSEE